MKLLKLIEEECIPCKKQLKEYSEKVLNGLIDNFKRQNRNLDNEQIKFYINRFDQLKNSIAKKIEDKDQGILQTIPKDLLEKNKWRDITLWKRWVDLEKLIDLFPSSKKQQKAVPEVEENTAQTDGNLVYNKNNLEVYRGDSEHRCVKYGSKGGKLEYYSWCVSRSNPAQNMYYSYRFKEEKSRVFYFIFDRDLSSAKDAKGKFKDILHACVIHVYEKDNGKYFKFTDASNSEYSEFPDYRSPAVEWDKLLSMLSKENIPHFQEWYNKVKGLESVLKYVPPSSEETELNVLKGKIITLDQYNSLSYNTKLLYLKDNAKDVKSDIFNTLDPTLKNLCIINGRKCSYDELKSNRGLVKKYAEYFLTHYQDEKNILPPIFLPYLKPELQEKYYNDNEKEYMTYEFIQKYLGEEILKKYVDKQIKTLDFIPRDGLRLVPEELQKTYKVIQDLQNNWKYTSNTGNFNVADNETIASNQVVMPSSISLKEWIEMDPEDRQHVSKLIDKIGNNNNYVAALWAFPYTIKTKNGQYYILPTDPNVETWDNEAEYNIVDQNGKVIKNNLSLSDVTEAGKPISELTTYDNVQRIFDGNKVKIGNVPFKDAIDSRGSMYEDVNKYIFQRRAGIV